MSLKLKLSRVGRTSLASYRIVVAEERSKRNGKVVATLGYYNPKSTPVVDRMELKKWISQGAKPTLSVKKLLAL